MRLVWVVVGGLVLLACGAWIAPHGAEPAGPHAGRAGVTVSGATPAGAALGHHWAAATPIGTEVSPRRPRRACLAARGLPPNPELAGTRRRFGRRPRRPGPAGARTSP